MYIPFYMPFALLYAEKGVNCAVCCAVSYCVYVEKGIRIVADGPTRACYYFRQTMRTRTARNMTLTREGKDNLFEFKQHRCLVVGPDKAKVFVRADAHIGAWDFLVPFL
jgi:hypothetical protein